MEGSEVILGSIGLIKIYESSVYSISTLCFLLGLSCTVSWFFPVKWADNFDSSNLLFLEVDLLLEEEDLEEQIERLLAPYISSDDLLRIYLTDLFFQPDERPLLLDDRYDILFY